jgi:hypothetical protein
MQANAHLVAQRLQPREAAAKLALLADLLDRFAGWTNFRLLCGDSSVATLLCALTFIALRPRSLTTDVVD